MSISETTPAKKKPFYKRWWVITLVIVFVLGAGANMSKGNNNPSSAGGDTQSSEQQSKSDKKAEKEKQKQEEKQKQAKEQAEKDAQRAAKGAEMEAKFNERSGTLEQKLEWGSPTAYLTSWAMINDHTLGVTVQEVVTKENAKRAGRAIFASIGHDYPDLEWIQVNYLKDKKGGGNSIDYVNVSRSSVVGI